MRETTQFRTELQGLLLVGLQGGKERKKYLKTQGVTTKEHFLKSISISCTDHVNSATAGLESSEGAVRATLKYFAQIGSAVSKALEDQYILLGLIKAGKGASSKHRIG